MKSKTTFWGQVGAAASFLQGLGVTGAFITTDELQKKILAYCALVGFIIGGVAKSIAGVATADAAVVQPEKNDKVEPPKT